MKTPIEVRLKGPTLLCRAVEALLATVGPIWAEDDGKGVAEGTTEDPLGPSPFRRRSPVTGDGAVVTLLVGEGWQYHLTSEARAPRRNSARGDTDLSRYALIADGERLDFYNARKMAVNAFIGTDEPIPVLVQGIQAAAQNRLFCSPQLLPALITAVESGATLGNAKGMKNGAARANVDSENASQAALLSAREHAVALHAARGLSNEQIAVFLGISVPTVKFHLMHAFRKLDIQRRTQLYMFMPFFISATEALLPTVVK